MPSTPTDILCTGAEWLTVRAGGLNRYTDGLARALVAKGVTQEWLVIGDEDLTPAEGVRVRAVARPRDSLLKRWRAISEAWADVAAPELVVSHFALYGFPLRHRLARLPHVVHFHGPWASESSAEGAGRIVSGMKRYVERSVYSTGDRFITLSEAFADILSEHYGVDRERIEVVAGGVDIDRFALDIERSETRRQLGWPADRPVVLCVRRLVKRMGLEQLVEAMAGVHRHCPDALLLIAGKGKLSDALKAQIEQQGLSESVRLLGFVPDEDLPLAYRAADLTIVPSQSLEGFGLIIAESLASGTPALVTPVGGMPEVVCDLDAGLVIEGPEVASIEAALTSALLGDKSLPSEQACQAYARRRFAWSEVAGQVLSVYQKAIVTQ